MTREEHLKWCKQRAIQEYDYYPRPEDKVRNGLTSMMSDMRKHPDTSDPIITSLIFAQMGVSMTRQQFIHFIEGFN